MRDLKLELAKHPFLQGMTGDDLEVLARHAREVEFKADEILCSQGQPAYEFFLITEGKICIEARTPKAGNVTLQTITGGDVLGWSWLFPPFSWHFQARAFEPTKAIWLDGASLLIACERDHEFGYRLMSRVAQIVLDRLVAKRKRLVQFHPLEWTLTAVGDTISFERGDEPEANQTLETLLAAHPFLLGMSPQHLERLAQCAMKTRFTPGQFVFREGEMANRFYLLQRGKVLVQLPVTDERALPIQAVGSGGVVGWSWLFPPFYWHFDALALEPTDAIFFYGTRLREECDQDADLGYELMKRFVRVMIHRLEATLQQLLELRVSRDAAHKRRVESRSESPAVRAA